MATDEINTKTATFDDIERFARNLLRVAHAPSGASDPAAEVAYWRTLTQVVVARRMFESAGKLASEIDAARSSVAKGLEKLDQRLDRLDVAIKAATDVAQKSAADAGRQSRWMIAATWGLVVATLILGAVTGGLVFYTKALVDVAPIIVNVPPK